jgi:thioredoxin reductase (NADPH)
MREQELVIIGGGPCGLTCGIYSTRGKVDTLILEKLAPGGLMNNTELVENYPGFIEPVMGPDLAASMTEQAKRLGVRFESSEVLEIAREGDALIVNTDSGPIKARAVVVATGANPKLLGIPGENENFGRGVSTCATCDANFFRGLPIAVVGGGDAAVQETIYLARFCSEITLVHRRDELRAQKVLQDRLFALPNVKVTWDSVVTEVLSDDGEVTGVRIRNKKTGADSVLAVKGFFEFIGHTPNSQLVPKEVQKSDDGFIVTDAHLGTGIPGLFAAGDVRAGAMRQIATAVGDGALASRSVEEFLRG